MLVHFATTSAMSSSSTSSFSIRCVFCSSARRASASWIFRLELGQPAVLQLRRLLVVAGALGALDLEAHLLELLLQLAAGLDRVLLLLPVRQ